MLTTNQEKPSILSISLKKLVEEILNRKNSRNLKQEDYNFAIKIIHQAYLPSLRSDNFCIDLTDDNLEKNKLPALSNWTKNQYIAFGKLYAAFAAKAERYIVNELEKNIPVRDEVKELWLKLPKQCDNNRKAINEIKKKIENAKFSVIFGNENWISLHRHINPSTHSPIVNAAGIKKSVSVVIMTDTGKVLLLKRGGRSGRAGIWGTLTGILDTNESGQQGMLREVHEEINCLLDPDKIHYVGAAYTKDLGKDLANNGKTVTYSDDRSEVYSVTVPESELVETIELTDGENTHWKLFNPEELAEVLKPCHGQEHVAYAKCRAALENAGCVIRQNFSYPYTKSLGGISIFSPKITNTTEERAAAKIKLD